jgi:anaerobic selenocysteine-containing dehydrogenase
MRAFGESLCVYRPPVDMKTIDPIIGTKPNGNGEVVLNFITPHQKWGIHSTYTDNLLMLTLNRGGPMVWISEVDAKKVGIEDNDWIEAYNANGAIAARAVVSQRVPEGMSMMYHAQEKITNTPGSEVDPDPRRDPQLGDARGAEAHPHDRRLRAVELRLQLLRHRRLQPRRIRHRPQDEQDRLDGRTRPSRLRRGGPLK